MSSLTTFLAKLIGLGTVCIAGAMAFNKPSMLASINTLFHEPAFILTYGIIALIAGLAMVIGHNVWSGGVLPVAVTVVGWVVLLRGLLLLLLPPGAILGIVAAVHFVEFYTGYVVIIFVIGACFAYAGFRESA